MSVITLEEAIEKRQRRKKEGISVVFTNGCFDILHSGHLKLLSEARNQGDYLVVGLNSDSSLRRLKGEGRPVLPENERAQLLDAICWVDDVIIFEEDTPLNLIKELVPDVLVKGADYEKEDIVGAEFVEENGGRVYRVKLKKGKATTDIISKIRLS
ncbi:MAG: D-glycero-beta-D-manno-heptose 1-phosphate adenylyltransferase [bacterium]